MNVHVTLNGSPALDARVELWRGGRPSTCDVTLPVGAAIAEGAPLELRVGDGESLRVLRQFVARRVETTGDGRVRVHGSDLREHWRTPVNVTVNSADGDGTTVRDPLTAQQAVTRLFEGAGRGDEAPALPPGAAAPPPLRLSGRLGDQCERLLATIALTLTVDDDGAVQVTPVHDEPEVDASRLLEESVSRTPVRVVVAGDTSVELVTLTDWQAVLPDDDARLRPLEDVLAEWNVPEAAARQACLGDGGFEKLLPTTGMNGAARLATLKRYAFRLFHNTDPREWIPAGGWTDDGTLTPPKLVARIARPLGVAPDHPGQRTLEETISEPVEAFELDAERRTVYLPAPPFALSDSDDPTLQARTLEGAPKLELTVAVPSSRPPLIAEFGDGPEAETLHAPHLLAVYDEDGVLLNESALQAAGSAIAQAHNSTRVVRRRRLAGAADVSAGGSCERVSIVAGTAGLITVVHEAPPRQSVVPDQGVGRAFVRSAEPRPAGLHQPVNAFRGGPLVIRASGETPEGESVLAMEATHRRDDTGALELKHPGALAFPFHLPSIDPAKFGRWFFVAGVEVTDAGRLRVLAPDERHEELPLTETFKTRHVPPTALRGLIVSLGDEPQLIDTGPLVADTRGADPGASSSLVYDLDGSRLSERRRGGLQFLTALALSPAHQREGARDGGWVPALNFRDGATGSPETPGRGLFAEGDGRSLGRLTATLQGGPILADAASCSKHAYGAAADDGLYREAAGHVSTDAFFKIPGDDVHDAPIKFYPEPFRGGVPPWPPYEAQLKYDAAERHPWNRGLREGRWKIQYRVPFYPEIPPTWRPPFEPPPEDPPPDDPPGIHNPAMQRVPRTIAPVVTENEVWAPSHDWLPAQSNRESERDIPMRGPSITSEGWAGEADGIPDPSLGGGCIYLPPDVAMPDAQNDRGSRQTYLALHPEVVLAFGHPGFSGGAQGHVHSGWALLLAEGDLHVQPRDIDASIDAGLSRGMHVTGHMQIGPDGADFGDSQALRLGADESEGIAFGQDTTLYRNQPESLRTDGALEVGGKLTVGGLIDPTGLELEAQAENPGNVAANTLWINSSDGRLYFGDEKIAFASELPE